MDKPNPNAVPKAKSVTPAPSMPSKPNAKPGTIVNKPKGGKGMPKGMPPKKGKPC